MQNIVLNLNTRLLKFLCLDFDFKTLVPKPGQTGYLLPTNLSGVSTAEMRDTVTAQVLLTLKVATESSASNLN
jgi:hypothetical protein